MKVLLIGGLDVSLIRFRGDLISTLIARGHQVLACAPIQDAAVREALEKLGARCADIRIDTQSINPLRDLQSFFALVRLLRRERPAVVLSYTAKPVIYSSLAARLLRIAYVPMITGLGYAFIEGNTLKRRIAGAMVRLLYRRALTRAHCVLFQNGDDEAVFRDLRLIAPGQRTQKINGSGINLAQFPVSELPDAPRFLMVARLLADKGVREYAAAARVVRAQRPQAHFTLVGGLDANPAAVRADEVREWVDQGVLDYTGPLPDVRGELKRCSVFVLPSYREGTPRSVLEGMSSGRAVITTDAPGCRETVTDGVNGLLVPVRDAAALATAMLKLIDQPQRVREMGVAGRRVAEEKFDVIKVNDDIIQVLTSAGQARA